MLNVFQRDTRRVSISLRKVEVGEGGNTRLCQIMNGRNLSQVVVITYAEAPRPLPPHAITTGPSHLLITPLEVTFNNTTSGLLRGGWRGCRA